jgi:hypothetical protein
MPSPSRASGGKPPATSRKLDSMTLEERLAYLQSVRERYVAERKSRRLT